MIDINMNEIGYDESKIVGFSENIFINAELTNRNRIKSQLCPKTSETCIC